VACSNRETIKLAARLGIGVDLAFVDPREAKQWWTTTTASQGRMRADRPCGESNICMVSSFRCIATGRRRGAAARRLPLLRYALGHHYGFGEHIPGRSDIWAAFQKAQAAAGPDAPGAGGEGGIGTPEQLRKHMRGFQESGVDQVAFIQRAAATSTSKICEALDLFAREVMPEFKEKEAERVQRKTKELAPYVEKAMARKKYMTPLADAEFPKSSRSAARSPNACARGQELPAPQPGSAGEGSRRWRRRSRRWMRRRSS